jgi:galactose-1-phosphate uridylyltransferase
VDLQDHHITYFLVELAGPDAWLQPQRPAVEMLAARLQSEWTDVNQLKQVKQGLDQALEAVQRLQCPDWVRYVEGYRALTDEHLNRAIKHHVSQVFSRMG